jgi:hypothetical protein
MQVDNQLPANCTGKSATSVLQHIPPRLIMYTICTVGWDSVDDIVTCYGLDGMRTESQWGKDFLYWSTLALVPIQPPAKLVLCLFPWGQAAGAWP